MARQRLQRGQFAHIQVWPRCVEAALQPAFDKRRQAGQHGVTRGLGPGAAGFVRGCQQVGGEAVAAARFAACCRRKVQRQTVTVEVGRRLFAQRGPGRLVAQRQCARRQLFQAGVGVGVEIPAQAGQVAAQARLQRHLHAAGSCKVAQQGFRRRRQRQTQCGRRAFHLQQRGLLHAHRHGRHDGLHDLHAVARRRRAGGLGRGAQPIDARGTSRHQHRPAHFSSSPSGQRHGLRCQRCHRQRGRGPGRRGWARGLTHQRGLHRHRSGRGVAQREAGLEAVALAGQRRQACEHLQILRHAHAGAASTETRQLAAFNLPVDTGRIGNRDQAEAGQRIVQRHRNLRAALGIELHRAAPQQQRVEELTRGVAAAAAAGRQRLAAVVASADDLALRGGGAHAPGARLQQAFQQLPRRIGLQRQQTFVHRREGHFGPRQRPALVADLYRGLHGFTHRVLRLVGRHLHVQPVLRAAHLQGGHTELEAGLRQVDQRRRRAPLLALVTEGAPPIGRVAPTPGEEAPPRRFPQTAPQHQHAHHHVGRPGAPCVSRNGQLDHRFTATQLHDARLQHAFTFHRHQCRGLAEGHAHLQPRGLTRLDLALLGQDVDAVVVVLRKPPLAAAADPHRRSRLGRAAGVVFCAGDQFHFALGLQLHVAGQAALGVGLAAAQHAQLFHAALLVVGIEAADDAFACAEALLQPAQHFHTAAFQRLAIVGQDHGRHRARGRAVLANAQCRPAGRTQAHHHRSRPQTQALRHGLHLAVRVGEAQLGQQVGRGRQGRQARHHHPRGALGVGAGAQLVGHQLLAVAVAFVFFHPRAARRVEAEIVEGRELRRHGPQQRRQLQRCGRHRPARQRVQLRSKRHFSRRHQFARGPAEASIQQRHAEGLDPKGAAGK